ncbi:HD-GYP domain-containing protein [Ammoniphilus sp. CFH 90114]|uniref:HD-GYP domain-containing protein n=1 Tax=Ammoniphilus sp. CFH 90114 TaxID=2493665 RepID=UPI00100F01FF|nr:HD-GYP domain-containing protein [Ammoniphilus sp. CFH 90114]RXT08974.1 HD-GYP domain-containing protein [Ammoniphilus sp. CFH 90114]
MRLVSIVNCESGMVLAKTIYHESGRKLLGEGFELSDKAINRLEEQGITHLYIKDGITDDIFVEDAIPLEVRREAVITIHTHFEAIQDGQKGAIFHSRMIKDFKRILDLLISEIKGTKSVMNLLSHIQVRDHYVFSHSLNVTLYTLAVATKRGFNDKQLYEIGLGGLLHDIGKMMIPSEILHKPGRLTDEEFDEIKKHSEYGFELLRKQVDIPLLSAHCALQHHEKWNGKGYPRGLAGEQIHPYARTMAVGDVFDALTTHRVYRRAMLPHEAMEIIYADTNTHFEQGVVELFRRTIAIYPVGVTVKLNSGETAVVVGYNEHSPSRPLVRVIKDPAGNPLASHYELDLLKDLSCMIIECDAIL